MFKLLLMLMLACQDQSPTTEIKEAPSDDPDNQQLINLFSSIIGRQLNPTNPSDRNIAELAGKPYQQQVDAILNSQQFIDEGFFHLHQQRMSLLRRQDSATLDIIGGPHDLDALRLEMKELAKKSRNYWDILNYRHRYLAFSYTGITGLECALNSRGCSLQEIQMQIVILLNNKSDRVNEGELLYPYLDRCCTESQGQYVTKNQPQEQHKSFCKTASLLAYEVFNGKNFCQLATTDDGEQSSKEHTDQQATPNDSKWGKLHVAVNFYLSLFLGVRTDEWFGAHLDSADIENLPAGQQLPVVKFKGNYYLKVKFPEDLQGIHASPFWLWTHRTSPANQHLRRARVIYHSWFCQGISPDQAMKTTVPPTKKELDEFSVYFADNDQHAKGDNNCFGCHKEVQPLANYFGKLAGASSVESDSLYGLGKKFLAQPEDSFDRPAGYWQDGEFKDNGVRGLVGLARALPTIPKVSECLVNSAYNTMIGSDLPQLTADEVSGAISKFKTTGNNYRQLLKYLLLTDKAETYFTVSRAKMEEKFADESSCPEKVASSAIEPIIEDSCANCHNSNGIVVFEEGKNKFLDDNKLLSAYQRVFVEGNMPPTSAPQQLTSDNKKTLECYLKQTLDENGQQLPIKSNILDDKLHTILETK